MLLSTLASEKLTVENQEAVSPKLTHQLQTLFSNSAVKEEHFVVKPTDDEVKDESLEDKDKPVVKTKPSLAVILLVYIICTTGLFNNKLNTILPSSFSDSVIFITKIFLAALMFGLIYNYLL
jgi:hypothetical protein